ncbi:MAG: protein kinase, partial [Chloroflexi bacterium]|nr:protein kinase [Chloroflexota bacterium]
MSDLIGKTLGKYQLIIRIGRGGMARVYKAYQSSLDRYVAIKVLHSYLAEEGDFVDRFEREATAVARLRHPNIVQVYDYDVEGDLYYIVMEFVEGPTLKTEMEERRKRHVGNGQQLFTLDEVAGIFTTLSEAIDYAHSRGMIHRDLKPANIMITAEGQILLTDFGLSRMIDASRLTKTGAVSGTPAYMAPEQVQGDKGDERSDIYSLGILLYELLTGRVPFDADSPYAVMAKHVSDPVPSLLQFNPELPEAIAHVVLKALHKDPGERYQSTQEIVADLLLAMGLIHDQVRSKGSLEPVAMMPLNLDVTPTPGLRVITPTREAIATPYRGLYAFREEDAPFFFGREAFTDRLARTVAEKSMASVIGPSGSGKSSVVFAGLVPRLREEGEWIIVEARPGSRPFYNLAAALLPHLEPEMGETGRLLETQRLAEALQQEQLALADVIGRVVQKDANKTRLLLVVDQFEELYTLCTDGEARRRFPNALFEAIHTAREQNTFRLTLVLTLRADFMGQALADRPFADALQEADVKLGPMTRAELGRAIESPAGKQNVSFEAGLVERILDDVGEEPGNLPLLEFALTLLWERRHGRRLTHAAYEAVGRVEGALARYADEVYETLDEADKERARRVFTQMVRPGEGTEDTRRLATRAELGENDWVLAQRLADARLVVTGRTPDGQETAEVVHEALIRGWGRLLEWMNNDRAFRAWQERLRAAIRQWESSDRDEGALLRGVPLGEAEEWLQRQDRDLSKLEREYIKTGIAQREQRAAEREAQRRRELEAAQLLAEEQQRRAEAERQRADEHARATQRFRTLATVLAVVFLLAVMAAIFAIGQRQDAVQEAQARATEVVVRSTAEANAETSAGLAVTRAAEALEAQVTAEAERFRADGAAGEALAAKEEAEQERDRADAQAQLALSRQLAAQSTTLLGPQFDLALLLSLEANNIVESTEAQGSLLTALQTNPNIVTFLRGHRGIVQSVTFSPDGRYLASAGADGLVFLWDLSGDRPPAGPLRQFAGHDPAQLVNKVVFSPDGRWLATASDDLTARIWDVASGEAIQTLSGHSQWVQSIAFSPDGQLVATSSGDRTAIIWEVATGQPLQTLRGHTGFVWDLAFSPDGSQLATAATDTTLILWDATTGQLLRTLAGHQNGVFGVAFSPDGRLLASAGADNNLILWDVATGEMVHEPLQGHVAGLIGVAFSPDGQQVASASNDSTVRLWDVATGGQITLFGNHTAGVPAVNFSPDGRMLASGDGNGLIILWDVSPDGPSFGDSVGGHDGSATYVSFSPDGTLLASSGADSTIRFWDPASGEPVGQPITHALRITEPVISLALSPDGSLLASGSANGTMVIWNMTTGQPVTSSVTAQANGVTTLLFSPDGQFLVSGGRNGVVLVWDAASGALVSPGLTGHSGPVTALAVSADEQYVASASQDGTVVIRPASDIDAGQGQGDPLTYTSALSTVVLSLAFSPD